MPDDVKADVAALPEAEVMQLNRDGLPTFIRGELGKIDPSHVDDRLTPDASLRPALSAVVAPFRLRSEDLRLVRINTDEVGNRAYRYQQVKDGLEVVGGDLVGHVDIKGAISGVNGTARGDIPNTLGKRDIGPTAAVARVIDDTRYASFASTAEPRLVYIITASGAMHKAYETIFEGMRGADPARDKVFVSVDSGEIVAVHPTIHFARNRTTYSANNGSSLPGTVKRTEAQGPVSDIDVNAAHDGAGYTYDMYNTFFGRDSYNNAGAELKSSVHYSVNYCNAFWNGTQMAYGDGSGSSCLPLARSVDVTAHELTHAVTGAESNLTYSGEPGGLNEAMSDIFGSVTEAWVDGGKSGTDLAVSSDTWKIGEDILPPYLRLMNDPAADGDSLDFWDENAGSVDVHYNSGIANLAFYLLSQGGTHPRGKSTNVVPGIGMENAARIFYKANVDIFTSNTNFAMAKTGTEQAAQALGMSASDIAAVTEAWKAVGVGVPPPPVNATPLVNGQTVSGISGASGSKKYYSLAVPSGQSNLSFVMSGGSGDADLYVQYGQAPTTSVWQCRPYTGGNSETCNFSNPAAGTWYVMIVGYTSYSSTTLKGTYSGSSGGDIPPPPNDGVTILVNGTPVTAISGGTRSTKFWKIGVPAGKTLTVRINGGSGDADLYTRFGAKPTTSNYACRPYLNGNTETCTHTTTTAGWWYVMIRGFTSYSGVALNGSYP
jgi:vibriolysin